LFGDEIDSIRTFDPDSQRSLYPVPEVRLLPGREFPMDEAARERASLALAKLNSRHAGHTWRLSRQLEALTGLEARVTILGYVQRGGAPSATDRLLATQLGTRCIELLEEGHSGIMVAVRGKAIVPVPLRDVAGTVKLVPPDHPWLDSARPIRTRRGPQQNARRDINDRQNLCPIGPVNL